MSDILYQVWPFLLAAAYIVFGGWAAVHVVLSRRDVRSAIGWMGLIALTPLVGAILYMLFGVNRVHRAAIRLRGEPPELPKPEQSTETPDEAIWQIYETGHSHFATQARLVGRLTGRPLTAGNAIEPLVGGDAVYPAMLEAIESAQKTIVLSSYIFDNDPLGREFVDAMQRAVERGVQVRVLVDSLGSRYSFPSIVGVLRKAQVPVARFMPSLSLAMIRFFNLRNHRKILVVDGKVGFTGGMNIRESCMLSRGARRPVQDLHFRLEGPVVGDLQHAFAVDWAYTTSELLDDPIWFPDIAAGEGVLARGITDGPDDDLDHLRLTFMGALSCARKSVKIVTPYFLPELPLIDALNVCSMRGVEVDIVLPSRNNLFYVHWATMATVAPLLERGVRIWLSPPPFDHTKLMVVDDAWCCFGSTNWDPRSLRLNFEFNVECYDSRLAAQLAAIADHKLGQCERLTLKSLGRRWLPTRLRDGVMRLLSPYL